MHIFSEDRLGSVAIWRFVGERCDEEADVFLGQDDPGGVTEFGSEKLVMETLGTQEDSLIERLTGLFMDVLVPCLFNWAFGRFR